MTPNEYQDKAVRTENRDFVAIRARLTPEVRALIAHRMNQLTLLGRELDTLKKYAFYGKGVVLPESDFVLGLISIANKDSEVNKDSELSDEMIRYLHAALGFVTEAAEFSDSTFNIVVHAQPVTHRVDYAKEIGDITWYAAVACDVNGIDLERVLEMNIDKLARRYPDKFSDVAAQNHDGH